ncbi:MAG: hypothetical protein ACK5CF_11190 [Opitutaceae bacterium]
MSWLHRLERWLGPVALPHLTLYLVVAQAFVYLTALLGLLDPSRVMLVPAAVMAGEWWRLLTFVADPPAAHWLFLAFALYFLYLSGSALEEQWGTVRYNLFLLVGYLLVVGTAFVTPYAPASNLFIGGSIFLAFAQLNPTFTMYVFLVLPIQIRWLALIAWLGYGWSFATGDLATRLSIAAALANYFLFMGHDLWLSLRQGVRRARAAPNGARDRRSGIGATSAARRMSATRSSISATAPSAPATSATARSTSVTTNTC